MPISRNVTRDPSYKLVNKTDKGEWYERTGSNSFLTRDPSNYIYFAAGSDNGYYSANTFDVPKQSLRETGGAQKPNWVDGTSTPGLATENRRAPIVPIPMNPGSAILVGEDQASADTKRPLGAYSGSNRPVVDRTTGALRTEEEEENRLRGAVLLR